MKQKLAIWKAKLNAWKAQAEAIWRDREILKAEWRTLVASFPIACKVVEDLSSTEFFGPTRTQIAFQRVRYELALVGHKTDELTGGMIFIAVSVAYLYQIKKIGKVA